MKRKPKIEYYWSFDHVNPPDYKVNWRLVGANGEIMCQSTQGFRDKTDAQRSVLAVSGELGDGSLLYRIDAGHLREIGPGRKPS